MQNLRKLACFLASVLLISAVTVSCSKADTAKTDTKSAETIAETVPAEEEMDSLQARQLISDDLPELDFKGEEFRMLVATEHLYDAWVEGETGDLIDDAVYLRNSNIEERFNVKIVEATHKDYLEISAQLRNSVKAGDDTYDLYLGHAVQSGGDALQGIFLNMYDLPYVNFQKPWYPQYAIDNLTIDGKMFLGVGDMCLSATENTYCMYYDKAKAVTYDIPDLYSLVKEGKWTIDKLKELTKDIYEDVNGDGKPDDEDFYGFTSNRFSHSVTYMWALNQPILKVTPDNQIELTFNNEKTLNIIEKIQSLFYGDKGARTFADHELAYTFFRNGHALFVNGYFSQAVNQYRDMESDFGIIPYPKYDEAQDAYYTMVDGNFSTIAVPQTVRNLEKVGAITEALCAYSWKNVIPVYYDTALKVKGARDEQSIEMMDLIMEGRVIDFAYLYDNWAGFSFAIQDFIAEGSNKEFSSFYASKEKSVMKHYQKVLDLFLEYATE